MLLWLTLPLILGFIWLWLNVPPEAGTEILQSALKFSPLFYVFFFAWFNIRSTAINK